MLDLSITENLTEESGPPEFETAPASLTVELDFANEEL